MDAREKARCEMMAKVHYGSNFECSDFSYEVPWVKCGLEEVRKLTTNIKLVTCKNCIKRILKKREV